MVTDTRVTGTALAGIRPVLEAAAAQYIEYLVNGNADGIAAMYAEDAILMPEDTGFVVGRDAIKAFYQYLISLNPVEGRIEHFTIEPEGEAIIVTGQYYFKSDSPGASEAVLYHGKFMESMKQEDGTWKFAAHIWNSGPLW